ncbi:type I-E CRISPR-associated protein Cse2/CasB [Haloechinothrix salitolerans]|uniref:Type I-E CRISPR-associated protein Cse2/CasB n=1 Tax=Haloechinothrix salitolerans TaxID=926830 RepID=A0ABW2BYB8_9PSEU
MTTPAPEAELATPAQSPRRLGSLGVALDKPIKALQAAYLRESSSARADLARLRRGIGKPAGSVPEIWELTIGAVPSKLAGKDDGLSRAEQAAHTALTLYAMHQQSVSIPMHVAGVSFGRAVGRLRLVDQRSEQAVTRRFMAAATAVSIAELLTHVRGLITQLGSAELGMDYAAFADDVSKLLTPATAQAVRLRWGRDFYRTRPVNTEPSDDSE